jgi:hypothetical protein
VRARGRLPRSLFTSVGLANNENVISDGQEDMAVIVMAETKAFAM